MERGVPRLAGRLPFGKEESAARNNHGTFMDMLVAGLALATGDRDLARTLVLDSRTKRVDPQIAADGSQPQELARTRSWHYSTFDLVAYTRLAAIGRQVGVNLWAYQGPQGQSLFKAVDYLLPRRPGRLLAPPRAGVLPLRGERCRPRGGGRGRREGPCGGAAP